MCNIIIKLCGSSVLNTLSKIELFGSQCVTFLVVAIEGCIRTELPPCTNVPAKHGTAAIAEPLFSVALLPFVIA